MTDEPTPYRPHSTTSPGPTTPSLSTTPRASPPRSPVYRPPLDHELLRTFRTQVLALGAVWIAFALLYAVLVLALLPPAMEASRILLLAPALISILFGIAIIQKRLWAIRAATFLSFCSVLAVAYRAFQLNAPLALLGLVVPLLLLLQGWRVLDWAHQIRAAGFPLTTTPRRSTPPQTAGKA